ncbi:fasciclin-like arabinogalactan protein 19 [Phtheirospermum japonicum]|uniref:Fasciclin-like arabinogalactan protein 19 n=1 Tax=Phtheirospermum japonicum TaxID=374723 RepID=A0A830CYL5_9LAMI|nr:fasciclin-like arabinogalactan protein 19 [Phtheirospermum japonicum]
MLQVLRNHGYTLFTNAIATSDVQYQLTNTTTSADADIPTPPFTLFAPVDELLFSLDMSADADVYVNTLRYHVIPNRRHTFADLRNLSSPFLETLLPHYSVLIGKIRDGHVDLFDNATVGVMVDGVRLSDTDLFLGSRIAVHGIDGILLTGLNMNHQFDRKENGSGHLSPSGYPAAKPELDRTITSKGTPTPMNSTVSPVTHSNGKNSTAPPGILQDKAEKSLSGKKKTKKQKQPGSHRRGVRVCHRRRSRGHEHCHHRLEDL